MSAIDTWLESETIFVYEEIAKLFIRYKRLSAEAQKYVVLCTNLIEGQPLRIGSIMCTVYGSTKVYVLQSEYGDRLLLAEAYPEDVGDIKTVLPNEVKRWEMITKL